MKPLIYIRNSFTTGIICAAVVLQFTSSALAITAARQSRIDPPPVQDRNVALAAVGDNTKAGNDPFQGFAYSSSSELDLGTVHLFTGTIFLPGEREWNLSATSSLPAKKETDAEENNYSDAQSLLPHGGVLNLYFHPLATTHANDPLLTRDPHARATASDRFYFNLKKESEKFGTEHQLKAYFLSGIGPKLINRSADNIEEKKASGYGLAVAAYAGLGFDGSIFRQSESSFESFGNMRLELYVSGSYVDRKSAKSLYPNATDPDQWSEAFGCNFVFVVSDLVNVQVTYAEPLKHRDYKGKLMLFSIGLNRPSGNKNK